MKVTATSVFALGMVTLSTAARLYVSSHSGNITTIDITPSAGGFDLEAVALSPGCAPNPSWLELDPQTSTLYCSEEGFPTPDTALVSSFKTSVNGDTLTKLSNVTTLNGGVSSVVYANSSLLAIAHYGGSGLTILNITDPANMQLMQNLTFTRKFSRPLQTQPRPLLHQVILDPTKKFMVVPDLGSDRVYALDVRPDGTLDFNDNLIVVEPAGSGPRHGVFYCPSPDKHYFYLVTEFTSILLGYEISYPQDSEMSFKEIYRGSVFGDREPPNNTTFAGEIVITPDNKFLILSSRGDESLSITNPDKSNSTEVVSDTLVTYKLNPEDGKVEKLQESGAGGSYPRSFALNKKGDVVAVALQKSSRIVLIKRNITTGLMGAIVGFLNVDGPVTSVIWDESSDIPKKQDNCDGV